MLIVTNPIYHSNIRQERLMIISNYTIVCALLVAAPAAIVGAVGSWYEIPALWDSTIGFTPCIALVCTISNFLMTANKNLDFYVASEVSGLSAFRTDKIILSVIEEEIVEMAVKRKSTIAEEQVIDMKSDTFTDSNRQFVV